MTIFVWTCIQWVSTEDNASGNIQMLQDHIQVPAWCVDSVTHVWHLVPGDWTDLKVNLNDTCEYCLVVMSEHWICAVYFESELMEIVQWECIVNGWVFLTYYSTAMDFYFIF